MPYQKRLQILVYRKLDIVETWLKYINVPTESIHLNTVCCQGLHSQLWEDMNINWWNDIATHSWQWTFSPSELSTYVINDVTHNKWWRTFTCTQKLEYSQLNVPHGTKQKKTNEETENKNRDAQKKRSSHKAVESVLKTVMYSSISSFSECFQRQIGLLLYTGRRRQRQRQRSQVSRNFRESPGNGRQSRG